MSAEQYPENLFEKKQPWIKFLRSLKVFLLTVLGVIAMIFFLNPNEAFTRLKNFFDQSFSEERNEALVVNAAPAGRMVELTALTDSSLEEELFPPETAPQVPLVVEEKKEPVKVAVVTLSREERIQTILKKAGFYQGKIDGKLGPMTIEAVKRFQKSRRLKVDGVIGEKTWQALLSYEKGR